MLTTEQQTDLLGHLRDVQAAVQANDKPAAAAALKAAADMLKESLQNDLATSMANPGEARRQVRALRTSYLRTRRAAQETGNTALVAEMDNLLTDFPDIPEEESA